MPIIRTEISNLENIFKIDSLQIPHYQRPYVWSKKSVIKLYSDILQAYHNKDIEEYRLGTIILHKDDNNDKYYLVDGQQRLITLSLLIYTLSNKELEVNLLKQEVNILSNKAILENYNYIEEVVNDIDYKIMEKYIDSFLYNTDDDLHKFIRDLFINIYNYSRNISIEIKNYLGNILYPRNIKEIINVEKYFDDIFEDVFKYSKEHLDNFLLYAAKDDNLIDKDNLMKSLINVLNKLESDALINKLTFIELKKVLSKLRNDLPDIIDDKTKYYFLNLIIDSAKDDINLIIDSIDFSAITKEEIDNMNPKNIHDVFNSFAKEYLNRLKLYGMFGGIVGIILVIIKHISLFNTDISNILNIIVIILTVILSICMIVNILKNISD